MLANAYFISTFLCFNHKKITKTCSHGPQSSDLIIADSEETNTESAENTFLTDWFY